MKEDLWASKILFQPEANVFDVQHIWIESGEEWRLTSDGNANVSRFQNANRQWHYISWGKKTIHALR